MPIFITIEIYASNLITEYFIKIIRSIGISVKVVRNFCF